MKTEAKEPSGDLGYSVPLSFASPYMDGVYLAVNAVPDSYLIYDAHDCGYYKAEKIAPNHDLFSDLLRWESIHRVVRTNLDSPDYIFGKGEKLSKKLLQIGERYRPKIVFVARHHVVIAAGHDAGPVIRDLQEKLGIPLVLIPDSNIDKDFVTGYLDALAGLMEVLPVEPSTSGKFPRKAMAIAGYLFDRNEGDHRGNIEEFQRLCAAMGVDAGPILLSGASFSDLASRGVPHLVLDCADGWDGAKKYASRCGAQYLSSPVPVGLAGTTDWILQMGKMLGLEGAAQKLIDKELGELTPMLQWLIPRYFAGMSVILFADRLLLRPLMAFLNELGMEVVGAGLTSEAFGQPVKEEDETIAGLPKIPLRIQAVRGFISRLKRERQADLIIGNSIIRQVTRDLGVPFLELGYPSHFHHCLHSSPFVGYQGVRVLSERIINVLEEFSIKPGIRPGFGDNS